MGHSFSAFSTSAVMLDDCAIDAPEVSSNKLQTLASRHQDWPQGDILSGGEEKEGRCVAEGKSLRRQCESSNQGLGHVVVGLWC